MFETTSITDLYMLILASLSPDDKLDLIAKLSTSMKEKSEVSKRPDLNTCFSGDWSDIDATTLRNNEYFGRSIENW